MQDFKNFIEGSEFRPFIDPDGQMFMIREVEGSLTMKLIDAAYPGEFDPRPTSVIVISIATSEGEMVHTEILQDLSQVIEAVEDFTIIADFMTYQKAPESSASQFALIDKSDPGYCVVATPRPDCAVGSHYFTARSKYLKAREPESGGVVSRSDSMLGAVGHLDTQLDLDRAHQENSIAP